MAYHDIATRAQVVTLKSLQKPPTVEEITKITGVVARSQTNIYKRAKERGFIPGNAVTTEHVKDAEKSGRPTTRVDEVSSNWS